MGTDALRPRAISDRASIWFGGVKTHDFVDACADQLSAGDRGPVTGSLRGGAAWGRGLRRQNVRLYRIGAAWFRGAAKRLRWHIDYLLAVPNVRIVQIVRSQGTVLVAGFGASDCTAGCGAHLKSLGPLAESLPAERVDVG